MLGRFLRHSSNYTLGSLLVTLASFISYPIFTRTFSVAEYGALNLISSVLLVWTGIGKLGVQQSIARFHAEVCAGHRPISESQYLATVLTGMGCTGIAAMAGCALTSLAIPAGWWKNEEVARLMLPLSVLIVVRVLDSAVSNILRAQQRSALLSTYSVLRRYLGLAIILLVMFYAVPRLDGFYLGTFIAEGGAVLVMLLYLVRKHHISIGSFSPSTFRPMIVFGLPMIAFEISGIVLILGARYVIQATLGGQALGHYSAAFNLCESLQIVLLVSFGQAVIPIYVRVWEEKGEQETRRFVERALRFYLMMAAAILAGMTAVGPLILSLMASDKYLEGAVVIPFVVAGMLVDGANPILGAGIYIYKRNRLIIPFMAAAAVLNIILNILLIPYLGIVAAGVATLICYSLIAFSVWKLGSRQFKVNIPIWDICKFCALAAIMYGAVQQVAIDNRILELLLKIFTGAVVYGLLVIGCDRQARELISQLKTFVTRQT